MNIQKRNLRLDVASLPTETDVKNIFEQVTTELEGFSQKNISLASSLVLAEVVSRLQAKTRFSISVVGWTPIFPGDKGIQPAGGEESHWWENTSK